MSSLSPIAQMRSHVWHQNGTHVDPHGQRGSSQLICDLARFPDSAKISYNNVHIKLPASDAKCKRVWIIRSATVCRRLSLPSFAATQSSGVRNRGRVVHHDG